MKDVIDSVLEVEKESENRLNEARQKAADTKKECDRELAERTRIVKEKLAGAYHSRAEETRRSLEDQYRKRVEAEKSLYEIPEDLRQEPYNSIVQDVVALILRSRTSSGE